MPLIVETVPCLSDNYAYLISEPRSAVCAVVDPAEAGPVVDALKGRRLTHILNTHHHGDHCGGNLDLKRGFGARVIGPAREAARIPGIDEGVDEGSSPMLFGEPLRILDTPGHTAGAICFVIAGAVFTGDSLFAMGCGRLFEGEPATLLASLQKIAALADDTKVYCGHEYAGKNARFALWAEPDNQALCARAQRVELASERGRPFETGFALATEKATNPFLRTHAPTIRASLGLEEASNVEVFAALRRQRDTF